MSEWSRYDFDTSSRDSTLLTTLYHISHVNDAQNIAKEYQITAKPVYDESRLNKTRRHVTWFSGNSWSEGSFYGTVQFSFPWDQILANRKIYWVESIDYKPNAFRYLITDRKPPAQDKATVYDPTSDNGPLKTVKGKWYFNGSLTSEFMVEDSISLSICSEISCISHHPRICRLHKSSCPEVNQDWTKSAALFIGYLLGTRNKRLNDSITPDVGLPNGKLGVTMLRGAVSGFYTGVAKPVKNFGTIDLDRDGEILARAAALQYSIGQTDCARETTSLLASRERFDELITSLISEHFGVPAADFT